MRTFCKPMILKKSLRSSIWISSTILENSNKLETIKQISILVVRHLIEKFRREIHSVMDTKSIFSINIVINENRLQNIFTKELEKLITLEKIPMMNERDEPEEEENKEFTMCTPQKVRTKKKTLEFYGNLNHPRSSHAVCYCNGYLYIVEYAITKRVKACCHKLLRNMM